jgi:hypothetical protein
MSAEKKPRLRSGGFKSSAGPTFGPLVEVFDGVWWAWGTVRFLPGITFPRNMFVLREKDELVVVHAVMLPELEQKKLEKLGKVKHIVKLGAFHGMDDGKYVERYGAKVWAPPDVDHPPGAKTDVTLEPGGELPFEGATLVDFHTSRSSEVVMHLPRHGGILLSCDSVQNWETTDGCSVLGGAMARVMGFKGRACIGPGWRKQCEPKEGENFHPTFKKILELDFAHGLTAHGPPMRDTAKADLKASVARAYGA